MTRWKSYVARKGGSSQKMTGSGNTSVPIVAPSTSYQLKPDARQQGGPTVEGKVRIAQKNATGIYVYTHTKITEGPFKGSNKISWLNNYDFQLLHAEGLIWTIGLLSTLARSKGIIK